MTFTPPAIQAGGFLLDQEAAATDVAMVRTAKYFKTSIRVKPSDILGLDKPDRGK